MRSSMIPISPFDAARRKGVDEGVPPALEGPPPLPPDVVGEPPCP